jgi:hypothetical protein
MDCINCGTALESKFCPACGQRSDVKRINFKEGWFDFWSRVYGFDGMFPRTLRDLTIRPGIVALSYINRNRIKYYGPIGYFFFMISVCLLIFGMIGLDYADYIKGVQSNFLLDQGAKNKMLPWITKFVSNNIKIFAFLIIPFQAISAKYFFFRTSGKNILEHSLLPFYTQGHMYWLVIITGIIFRLTGIMLNGYTAVIAIPYMGLAYTGFITYQSKQKVFFKGIASYLFATVLFISFIVVIGISAVLLIYRFNPELFEQFRPSNNR